MQAAVINQYPGSASTATRLLALFEEFCDRPKAQFRALVGFASASGFRRLEVGLARFLSKGHSFYCIVGIDLGGTGREALQYLIDLKREYTNRVDARVFSVGNNQMIFHPKVYWFDGADEKVVVVGSSNATVGGLDHNFETSIEIRLNDADDVLANEFDVLWMTYSTPLPPLEPSNLVTVDRRLVGLLGHDSPPTDSRLNLVHPLAGVPVPPTRRRTSRPVSTGSAPRSRELIMDILTETRATQVQLPTEVLESFFGASRVGTKTVRLRQVLNGNIVKEDMRPIINFRNNTHRIEIDGVRGVPRPLIVRFTKRLGRPARIDYELILRPSVEYRRLDALLNDSGVRRRSDARRWLLR
jgi:HKD family nuclease